MTWTSSLSEKPRSQDSRKLTDWLHPSGAKKVHSLIDKIYQRKNLELAWQKVKRNQGAGGIDGQSVQAFEEQLDSQLNRLHTELRDNTYRPLPVRQQLIPKPGQPGTYRSLGIPTVSANYPGSQRVVGMG